MGWGGGGAGRNSVHLHLCVQLDSTLPVFHNIPQIEDFSGLEFVCKTMYPCRPFSDIRCFFWSQRKWDSQFVCVCVILWILFGFLWSVLVAGRHVMCIHSHHLSPSPRRAMRLVQHPRPPCVGLEMSRVKMYLGESMQMPSVSMCFMRFLSITLLCSW